MAIKNKGAVQCLRTQVVTFDIADAPTGVFVPLFKLPQGAIVKGGFSHVNVVANSTTNVLDFGTSGSPNSLLNDDDAKILGGTAFTGVNIRYPAGATIGVTHTSTGGAATTGSFTASIDYVVEGSADEVFG